jgi:hypothetical protein
VLGGLHVVERVADHRALGGGEAGLAHGGDHDVGRRLAFPGVVGAGEDVACGFQVDAAGLDERVELFVVAGGREDDRELSPAQLGQ